MGGFFINQPLLCGTANTECVLLPIRKFTTNGKKQSSRKTTMIFSTEERSCFVSKINPFRDLGLGDVKQFSVLEPSSERPQTKKEQISLE